MENYIYRITYVLSTLPKQGSTKSSTPVPIRNNNVIIMSTSIFLKKNFHHLHCFLESPSVRWHIAKKKKMETEINGRQPLLLAVFLLFPSCNLYRLHHLHIVLYMISYISVSALVRPDTAYLACLAAPTQFGKGRWNRGDESFLTTPF